MKFKVGDKVRVREDLSRERRYGDFWVLKEMEEFLGKEARIISTDNLDEQYMLDIDNERWGWTDEMLEPITDPLADKIEERNNKQNDPIKPKHYRKGEIDLYESWYRTYPFNEFRAGMQMIAERYMKRDKDNRIQDLEKAIYTLSRLKEYEELEEEK